MIKSFLQRRLRKRRREVLLETLESRRLLAAVSPPAFLQWFDSSFDTVEQRTPDVFQAGYGAVWLPPPGRADSGDQSVGYDVYDRFDLGSPDHATLYGTETGLATVANAFDRAGVALHIDSVLNHAGFSDQGTSGFLDSGGYPGLAVKLPDAIDGDFHSGFEAGDLNGRLSGLVDIDHTTNHQLIRHPVDAAASNNIPAGDTADASGRLANVPTAKNARFYPDQDGDAIFLFDPVTNESNIPVYSFDADCSSCGDATAENATGYLMRYMQWMVQIVGVDGFRMDAAKHFEGFVMDFVDRAVYRSNPRTLLDGSTDHVFSYSEVFTGDKNTLLSFVKKNIDPADPGRIGGNRDALDFSAFFAMRDNLSSPGMSNAWQNVRDSLLDVHDDGLHNGSAGVLFVRSHDEFGPASLDNVAHAFALMHPGNAVVYMNGKEFGDARDFPKPGRGDALGGVYGDTISKLVAIRNTHGRGDMLERWMDDQGIYVFERDGSALVGLSNRGDSGYDERTVQVNFAPGTHLIELTGNASDLAIDPNDDIQPVLTVSAEGTIAMRIPRNFNANGEFHGKGYVIYGLPAPQATAGLELTGVDSVLAGSVPPATDYENGRTRLSDLQVVTGDSLQVKLQTDEVNLLGLSSLRDVFADGDNALLRIDGGIDLNGNGAVDFVAPGLASYGFEQFVDKSSPRVGSSGLGGPAGDGEFLQTIDTTALSEGTHFLEVRAFRHRTDGGPAIFSDFKESIYVDRLPPDSGVLSFDSYTAGINENRDLIIQSLDKTADNVHVFLNLAAGITDTEVVQLVAGENQARKIDRDQFIFGYSSVPHGNNVATIVSYEPTGSVNVQRVPGLFTSTIVGAGLGDLDFDGDVDLNDTQQFEIVFFSDNAQFNPAADFNGDGQIDYADLDLFSISQADAGADQTILDAIEATRALKFGAVADSYSLNEDETFTQAAPGVLANDLDPGSGADFGISTLGSITSEQGVTVTLAADGSFNFPSAGVFGYLTSQQTQTDTFAYSVTDGLSHSSIATVTLTVQGINDAPTLAAIGNVTVNEDAVEQIIDLTGIGAGAGESQDLLVTATSDTPGLIPQPEVVYTSPNATGSLKYTPVANGSGTAEIVVTVADGGLDGNLGTPGDNGTINRTVVIVVNPVNDPPTLDALDDLEIDEDASLQTIQLAGIHAGPLETQTLRVTATSDNTDLIPDPAVTYNSADSTGSLSFTPVADQSGTATITVTVEDAGLDNDLATTADNETFIRTYVCNIKAINDVPTLDTLDDLEIDEDAPLQTIQLAGIHAGPLETQTLRVTATSDNTDLIPDPAVTYNSADSTGSLSFTPVADQSGTATITVTVEDAGLDNDLATADDNATISRTVIVYGKAINDVPTLDTLDDLEIDEDAPLQTIQLAGIDAGPLETQTLRVTATSDNTDLIPDPAVTYNSADSTGSLSFTPVADQSGTATITVTVEDAGLDNDLATADDNATISRTVIVYGKAINDVPTLDTLDDLEIDEDAPLQTIQLAGIDAGPLETQTLRVTATSDNTDLIPDPAVTYNSADSTGSLSFTPVADQSGTATITVTVEDAGLDNDLATADDNATISRTVIVYGKAINDVPTLDTLDDLEIDEDAPLQTIQLAGIDAGPLETQTLRVTATSDNTDLIPDPAVTYNSADSTGSLSFTPVADQSGTATITVTVEDAGLDNDLATADDNATISRTVIVYGKAINDVPTLDTLDDLEIDEDAPLQTIQLAGIHAGPLETQTLRVTATSDNTDLIPDPAVTYNSADSTGSLSFTPVADQSGTATITVTVEDAGLDNDLATADDNATISRTVIVYGKAINDVPTLDTLDDLEIDEDAPLQTIQLAGIDAGPLETQTLRVTATSDNTDLIPDPAVTYNSADSTGSLSFTPVADQSGTATITVTVEDAGLDNDLATTADNETFIRTYVCNIKAINDVPTLDPLNAIALDENAAEQTIVLGGIDSGGGEGQLVRVTASHGNPELLSQPVVSYTEGDETGTLKFTPLTGQVGVSTITVQLEDSGPDGIFSSSEDNALATYDLRIGVGVTSFTVDGGKLNLRLREAGQGILFRETMNGFSLELTPGLWFGADAGGVTGADSNLLTFDASVSVPTIELAGDTTNSLSFADSSAWRMGVTVAEPTRFLRSVETAADSSRRVYLDWHRVWQNVIDPSDITNDGIVSAFDALTVINELSRGSVTDLLTGQLANPLNLAEWPGSYYDQNGDGLTSALDALRVLNRLALIGSGTAEGEKVAGLLMTLEKPERSSSGADKTDGVGPKGFDSEQVFLTQVEGATTSLDLWSTAVEEKKMKDVDQQQAVDAVMVHLLDDKVWLR